MTDEEETRCPCTALEAQGKLEHENAAYHHELGYPDAIAEDNDTKASLEIPRKKLSNLYYLKH